MDFKRNHYNVMKELCQIIKKSNMNTTNMITLRATMYLDILYYIDDIEKRKELMEMIQMEKASESEFFKWQDSCIVEGKKIGEKNGKKEIILKLLKKYPPEQISKDLDIPLEKINRIKNNR